MSDSYFFFCNVRYSNIMERNNASDDDDGFDTDEFDSDNSDESPHNEPEQNDSHYDAHTSTEFVVNTLILLHLIAQLPFQVFITTLYYD